jgi:hypothetical protein
MNLGRRRAHRAIWLLLAAGLPLLLLLALRARHEPAAPELPAQLSAPGAP